MNAAGLAQRILPVLIILTAVSGSSAGPRIPARAAVVIDAEKSVIYAKNPAEKLQPASTAKLITAMVVLDGIEPERVVRVSRNAAYTSSVEPGLRAGDELTVDDLLHLALMRSVNSASVALAEETAGSERRFAELMNKKAVSLGAWNSRFINSSGLPGKGQYTTAYDLALIMAEVLKYPLIREILGKKDAWVITRQGRALFVENTDKLLWASDNVIGGKTGYTHRARHCFVGAVETEHGTVYACVLGAGSRTRLWQTAGWLMGLGPGFDPSLYPDADERPKKAKKTALKRQKPKKSARLKAGERKKHQVKVSRKTKAKKSSTLPPVKS